METRAEFSRGERAAVAEAHVLGIGNETRLALMNNEWEEETSGLEIATPNESPTFSTGCSISARSFFPLPLLLLPPLPLSSPLIEPTVNRICSLANNNSSILRDYKSFQLYRFFFQVQRMMENLTNKVRFDLYSLDDN